MNRRHSGTGAAAPIPPVGGPQPSIDLQLINSALTSMTGLINLAEWIGHARDFIEGIETGKRLQPAFAEQLRKRDFAGAQVDWDEDVAEGMDALHYVLREHIGTISKAIRPEAAK